VARGWRGWQHCKNRRLSTARSLNLACTVPPPPPVLTGHVSSQRWLAAARALSPHAPATEEQHPARSPGGKPQRLRFILQLRSTCTALAERMETGRWISRLDARIRAIRHAPTLSRLPTQCPVSCLRLAEVARPVRAATVTCTRGTRDEERVSMWRGEACCNHKAAWAGASVISYTANVTL
jgi:hypothetical protein